MRPLRVCGLHLAAVALCCGLALPAQAADGDRGISIFDKYPECMKPDELKPADRKKCTIQDGPPHRPIPAGRSKGKENAAASGTGTQGESAENPPASGRVR